MSASHEEKSITGRLLQHIRRRLVSGALLMVPLVITFFMLQILFGLLSKFLRPVIFNLFHTRVPESILTSLAVLAFLVLLYLVGLITTHVIGRRLVGLGEYVLLRIPLVKTIYGAAKKAVDALSLSSRSSFKSVIMLEFPRAGFKSIGFVTGTILDSDGQMRIKVFVPNTPNPTTGYFLMVNRSDIQETDLTVEDGIKLIVSGGILSPDCITIRPPG